MTDKTKVALAIQGGGFPAGAYAAGVISGLVEAGAFDQYDICAFSGTSAGALVAAVCWGEAMKHAIDPQYRINGNLTAALEKQWMYLAFPNHLACIPVCPPVYAEALRDLDAQLMKNPMWRVFVEKWRTPFFRWIMGQWIDDTIPIAELNAMFKKNFAGKGRKSRPGLALGAADVVEGRIKIFHEEDLCASSLLASGSLDDCNGVTTIVNSPHAGTYLDGAWGDNPPVNELLDYGVDEIWFIQHFPKKISAPPIEPAARRERKDELWQNSLVEHEYEFVKVINRWWDMLNPAIAKAAEDFEDKLRSEGKLTGTTLQRYVKENKDKIDADSLRLFDEDDDFAVKQYKTVAVRAIDMHVERELGATIVNVPWFIRNMMSHGRERARQFVDADFGKEKDKASSLLPGWWASIPQPFNDFLCGRQAHAAPDKPYGPLQMACDLCIGKTMSGMIDLLPEAAPLQSLRAMLPPANTAICGTCHVH